MFAILHADTHSSATKLSAANVCVCVCVCVSPLAASHWTLILGSILCPLSELTLPSLMEMPLNSFHLALIIQESRIARLYECYWGVTVEML